MLQAAMMDIVFNYKTMISASTIVKLIYINEMYNCLDDVDKKRFQNSLASNGVIVLGLLQELECAVKKF